MSFRKVACFAWLLVFSLAARAQVSVLNQPGTVIGSVEIIYNGIISPTAFGQTSTYNSGLPVLYTVPAGRTLRLTDVVVTSRSVTTSGFNATGTCVFGFNRTDGSFGFLELAVPNKTTVSHSFLNGPGFAAGASIYLYGIVWGWSGSSPNVAPCEQSVFITLRGYLFTVP